MNGTDMTESNKFITGLIIGYFDQEDSHIHEIIKRNKEQGKINEALAIVLPFTPSGLGLPWQKRLENAEKMAYVDQKKQYDVWHQQPDTVKSNEEYLNSVLEALNKQYGHQSQTVILVDQT